MRFILSNFGPLNTALFAAASVIFVLMMIENAGGELIATFNQNITDTEGPF